MCVEVKVNVNVCLKRGRRVIYMYLQEHVSKGMRECCREKKQKNNIYKYIHI